MPRTKALLQILLLSLSLFVSLGQSEYHPELVQVLFRHGERAPLLKEMYPTDPHDVSEYEPWGLGQLTNEGRMREYKIGKMLRQRYGHFLGDVYRPQDLYAVSTDVDRTKMSLQLVLAGLYPPSLSQTWNPQLPWLPIPTHYAPERVDILLRPHACPVYEQALEEIKATKEVRDKIAVHNGLFKFLSEKTGIEMTEPSPVYEVYNLLSAQKAMNLTLPAWCTEEVYREMQNVVALEYEIRSYTTDLRRKTGGMMINRFIENMKLGVKEEENRRKIYLYSGHEVNLAAFTRAHGISEPRLPSFGTAIIFEKLKDDSGKSFVRMLLWTGAEEKLITLKLAGQEICPLEEYLDAVKDVLPTLEEKNCYWDRITKDELKELYAERLNFN